MTSTAPTLLRPFGWGLAALALLAPAIAMLLGAPGVAWGPGDFLAAAALLGLVGIGIELAVRVPFGTLARVGVIAAMVAAFLIVWAEFAVGIFD